jgi:hypothetical protein
VNLLTPAGDRCRAAVCVWTLHSLRVCARAKEAAVQCSVVREGSCRAVQRRAGQGWAVQCSAVREGGGWGRGGGGDGGRIRGNRRRTCVWTGAPTFT